MSDLEERLAAALDDTATGLWMGQHGPGWGDTVARILLPVVERYAARRAAEALREAAEAARGMHDPVAPDCAEWADWLDTRADALAPEEGRRG